MRAHGKSVFLLGFGWSIEIVRFGELRRLEMKDMRSGD
jgi:hypothetical protein